MRSGKDGQYNVYSAYPHFSLSTESEYRKIQFQSDSLCDAIQIEHPLQETLQQLAVELPVWVVGEEGAMQK